ncbi:MAG: hypothetical protein WCF24_05620 [Acidimicrobiales bacterium]
MTFDEWAGECADAQRELGRMIGVFVADAARYTHASLILLIATQLVRRYPSSVTGVIFVGSVAYFVGWCVFVIVRIVRVALHWKEEKASCRPQS